MKETLNYGFPYPECNPPLVKDASDISHFRNLALAVDSEVASLYAMSNDILTSPDGCLLFRSAAAIFNDGDSITYDSISFDNTGGAMPDLAGGFLNIRQTGFYYMGGFAQTLTPNTNMSLVFLINGMEGSRHNQASSGSALITAMVSCQQVQRLEAGDIVSLQFRGLDGSQLSRCGLSAVRIV